jgi:choline-sulfatase
MTRAAVVLALVAAACSKDAPPAQPASAQAQLTATATKASANAAASASAAPLAAAHPSSPPADCNVVLISIDSLRADMPWAGYSRPIAPRLVDFEKQAVSYTRAHSVSSYTAMSLGGLLGGRLPSELHRSGYFFGTYKSDIFFPKLLQSAGVHTMGVMAHMYFKGAGLDQGFDEWKLVPGITFDPNTDRDITSPQSEEVAEGLLAEPGNESRRFFFWVHFLDPHDQYLHHDGIDWGKDSRARYDGEVTFADRYVGKLLDFIAAKSWASRTAVIVTSDHGEEFGEHGMARHGFEVWETLVHVPLMIAAPGAPPRHVDVLRSALDLAPTILDFFGVAADPSFEGHSLVKEVYGAPAEEREVVVDLPMTSDNGRRRAILAGDRKLICFDNDGYCKLFDLALDPLEKTPTMRGPDYAEMKGRYDAFAKKVKEVSPFGCTGDCLDAVHRKK